MAQRTEGLTQNHRLVRNFEGEFQWILGYSKLIKFMGQKWLRLPERKKANAPLIRAKIQIERVFDATLCWNHLDTLQFPSMRTQRVYVAQRIFDQNFIN